MITNLKLILIFILFFLLYTIVNTREFMVNKKILLLLKYKKLEKQITHKYDNNNTKIKKIINHLIQILENNLLKHVNIITNFYINSKEFNKDKCKILKQPSLDIFQYFVTFDKEVVKAELNNSVNIFLNEYREYTNEYLKIPQHHKYKLIIKSNKPNLKKPEKIEELIDYGKNYINSFGFYELINCINQIKFKYTSENIKIIHETEIEKTLKNAINNLDLEKFVKQTMKLKRILYKEQCRINKKCCKLL